MANIACIESFLLTHLTKSDVSTYNNKVQHNKL